MATQIAKEGAANLLIHATNLHGLGASHLVASLLDPLCSKVEERTVVYLPAHGRLSSFRSTNPRVTTKAFTRMLPSAISRFLECFVPSPSFPPSERTLVLGDIPLRGRPRQCVLVHQPHLIKPEFNRFVSNSATYRVSRRLFENNLPAVTKVIVQTEAMREAIGRSYSALAERIAVIPQPAPSWLTRHDSPTARRASGSLTLFYPAAGYAHKNHQIFAKMDAAQKGGLPLLREIRITLSPSEAAAIGTFRWVRNVDRLDTDSCVATYREVDALFFPSVLESYGLPLVEAMTLGLPIIAADLPYAHSLCGNEAIYFDPLSGDAAWSAIAELASRLKSGWSPDWTSALLKLPVTWDEVADAFLRVIHED